MRQAEAEIGPIGVNPCELTLKYGTVLRHDSIQIVVIFVIYCFLDKEVCYPSGGVAESG